MSVNLFRLNRVLYIQNTDVLYIQNTDVLYIQNTDVLERKI